MNYIGKFFANFKDFYNEINAATLTGAIDVVVVQQANGEYVSSPFHVRFGKIGVLRSREKVVDIEINGEPVDIHMKLGETGEAFFVEKITDDQPVSEYLGTSPFPPKFFSPNELDCEVAKQLEFHDDPDESSQPTTCIDVPKRTDSTRRGHSRSKSFSSVAPLTAEHIIADGNGSRTDNEEIVQSTSRGRRKKRRKVSHAQRLSQEAKKLTDGHSSENSTTSEAPEIPCRNAFQISDSDNALFDSLSATQSMPQLCNSQNTTGWEPSPFGHNVHPFSDTDVSPRCSRNNSRSSTPVKSDTEYEIEKHRNDLEMENAAQMEGTKWSWTWGELPTPPSKVPSVPSNLPNLGDDEMGQPIETVEQKVLDAEAQQRSIGNMFSFMRYSKKTRRLPEREGIYLEDIDREGIDPELVSLYIPKTSFQDSQFKPVVKDEDLESGNGTSLPQSPHSMEGAIGGPKTAIDSDFEDSHHPIFYYKGYHNVAFSLCGQLTEYPSSEFPTSLFMQSLVTYDDFVENPDLINSPNLVVRLNNKYMNWATAAPELMSLVLFQRELPEKVKERLAEQNMPQKIRPRTQSRGYSWFSWGRSTNQEVTTENKIVKPEPGTLSPSQSMPIVTAAAPPTLPDIRSAMDLSTGLIIDDKKDSSGSDEDEKSGTKYRKSLRLTSEQIKKLNLKHGLNQVVFSVTTAYQGTCRCKCHIFLWNHDEKIVISDIDGTITKSDVLGHILPIIGNDWTQNGVAELYTKIKNNGYSFLYLSARAIGQAHVTRDYLQSIKQDNRTLPDGPLLLNPTSLIQAFHREVIIKKPEEFKISCLKDIQALFGNRNPFYAGFGNRLNDVWAYREVDVPITRIFTINHQGVIKHEHSQTFQTTYTGLCKMVNSTFPPVEDKMVPRSLLTYLYSDGDSDGVDLDYMDSEWEGIPTGLDAMQVL